MNSMRIFIFPRHPLYPPALMESFENHGISPKIIYAEGDIRLLKADVNRIKAQYNDRPSFRMINRSRRLAEEGNVIVDLLNQESKIRVHDAVYEVGGRTIAVVNSWNDFKNAVEDIVLKGGLVVSFSTDKEIDKTFTKDLFESLSDKHYHHPKRLLDETFLDEED